MGSKSSGLLSTGRTAELDTKLTQYKAEADFGDHLLPTHNLLELGVTGNALQALDDLIVEQAGMSLGSLHEDLLDKCLQDIEKNYSDAKARLDKEEKQGQVPLPTEELTNFRVGQRQEEPRPARLMRGHMASPLWHRDSQRLSCCLRRVSRPAPLSLRWSPPSSPSLKPEDRSRRQTSQWRWQT